jgi:hypothetical protein
LFIEKGINILNIENGMMSMIVPDRFFFTPSYIYTRKKIINETSVKSIVEITEGAFEQATVGNAIFVLAKSKMRELIQIKKPRQKGINEYEIINEIPQSNVNVENNYEINLLLSTRSILIIDKCINKSIQLKDSANCHVGMMIKNNDKMFVPEQKRGFSPIVKGRQLSRYSIINKSYFDMKKVIVFGGTKNLEKHQTSPKILLRKTGNVIYAALDNEGIFVEQSVYLVLPHGGVNPHFLCAVLNSKAMDYIYKNHFITNPDAFPYIQHYDLEKLPIPILDLSQKADKDKHDKLVSFVDQMLALKKKEQAEIVPQTKTMIGRQIQALDKQIDALVYGLYGLTEDEIKVVEGAK